MYLHELYIRGINLTFGKPALVINVLNGDKWGYEEVMQGTARSNRTQGVCTSKNFVINSLVAENNAADLEKILKKLNQKKLDDDSPHLVSFANCE